MRFACSLVVEGASLFSSYGAGDEEWVGASAAPPDAQFGVVDSATSHGGRDACGYPRHVEVHANCRHAERTLHRQMASCPRLQVTDTPIFHLKISFQLLVP